MDDSDLKFGIEPIAHLIEDRWLAVPRYQRPYAWDRSNVEEFWNDLRSGLEDNNRTYFLGAVVISGLRRNEERQEIIDGQQRLVTTSLLLFALRNQYGLLDALDDSGDIHSRFLAAHKRREGQSPRILVAEDDRQFYFDEVIDRKGGSPTTASQRRMRDALSTLSIALAKDLDARPEAQRLERIHSWLDYLENQVNVFTIDTRTEDDAFRIFETLNDRGAPLTVADLLKNYLMSISPADAALLQQNWLEAVAALGTETETQDFVNFLRYYWSSHYGATRERDLYSSIRAQVGSATQAIEFVEGVSTSARGYAAIFEPDSDYWAAFPEHTSRAIGTLLGLKLGQYRPLLMAALDTWKPEQTALLAECLTSWAFRGLIVGGIGGGTSERYYAQAAVRVRQGQSASVAAVFDSVRPIVAGDEEFRTAFETATISRPAVATYALRSLENGLTGVPHPSLVQSQSPAAPVVDHVLPKRPDLHEWSGFAPDVYSRFVYRVGNMFLVAPKQRATGSNWSERAQSAASQGFALNSGLRDFGQWTPESIRLRQQDLAAVAVRVWPRLPDEAAP